MVVAVGAGVRVGSAARVGMLAGEGIGEVGVAFSGADALVGVADGAGLGDRKSPAQAVAKLNSEKRRAVVDQTRRMALDRANGCFIDIDWLLWRLDPSRSGTEDIAISRFGLGVLLDSACC